MIGTVLILHSSPARTRWLRCAAAASGGLALPVLEIGTAAARVAALACAAVGVALAILARNGGPRGPVFLAGARARVIGPARIVLRCDAGTVAVWRDAVGGIAFRRLAAQLRWNPVRGN